MAVHENYRKIQVKRKTLPALLMSCAIIGLLVFPAFSVDPPKSKEAKQIAALVDKAVALIESKGKAAFPEFKKKDGEWFKGETYIFVLDMKGTTLLHPANPELETKSTLDLKDANGKVFIREFIETAKKGSGWVDYMWPKQVKKKPRKR